MRHLANALLVQMCHLANALLGQMCYLANALLGQMRHFAKCVNWPMCYRAKCDTWLNTSLGHCFTSPMDHSVKCLSWPKRHSFSNSEKEWLFWKNDAFLKWDFGQVTYSEFEIDKKLLSKPVRVSQLFVIKYETSPVPWNREHLKIRKMLSGILSKN